MKGTLSSAGSETNIQKFSQHQADFEIIIMFNHYSHCSQNIQHIKKIYFYTYGLLEEYYSINYLFLQYYKAYGIYFSKKVTPIYYL